MLNDKLLLITYLANNSNILKGILLFCMRSNNLFNLVKVSCFNRCTLFILIFFIFFLFEYAVCNDERPFFVFTFYFYFKILLFCFLRKLTLILRVFLTFCFSHLRFFNPKSMLFLSPLTLYQFCIISM